MLSEDILSVQVALGVLAGRVSEEDWALVKIARVNLVDLAEQARELERLPIEKNCNMEGQPA